MDTTTLHLVPDWLTKEYLETILQKYKDDKSLSVRDFQIKPATVKGENYASVMTRVNIKYQLGDNKDILNISVIVKTSHEGDPYISDIMRPYQVCETEMLMYETVLPKLTGLLKEIGDTDKLFADTIHVDNEHSAIIFEDLAVLEFACPDRLIGMDMKLAKLSLKKLAKMHATSSVLNERENGVLEKFDHGIFNRHTKGFSPFFVNMLTICSDYAESCENLGVYYKEKLLKLRERVVEYATRVYDKHEGFYHTLVHGDFWVNNVMLRNSNGSTSNCNKESQKLVHDLLLIDFQFSSWSPPSVDLHYFFNTSLDRETRLYHQEELVQFYYDVLTQTLRKLNFKGYIPTLHELWVQIEAGRFMAVTSTLVSQPMMINDKTEDADIGGLMRDDERGRNFRKLLYTNKAVQEYVEILLPIFDRRGLLDVID